MKKLKPFLFGILLLLSCSKSDKTSNNNDEITYELKATSGTLTQMYYLDETGSLTPTNVNSPQWTLKFINKAGKPRSLSLSCVALNGITPQPVTANIYVNNTLVKTASASGYVLVTHTLLP